MYRILFVSFFLLLTEYGFSQSLSYNKGGTNAKSYFEEIPYQDINGKMIVKVKINDIDYNFLFDTGAPMCLSPKILSALNADKVKNAQVKDVNGNSNSSPTAIINNIALGNLNFSGIPAVVGVPDFFKCWNVDGILGSNLLRNSIIQINSQKKTIIITDLTEKLQLGEKQGISLFLDTIQSYPVFKVQLSGNSTMRVNFDTGDNVLLSVSENSMDLLKKAKVYETIAKGYGANQRGAFGLENDNEKFLLKFLTFDIADVHLKNVMTVTSKGSGARMGSKLLDYGIVTIDFINQKFYFEGNAREIDLAEKQWPFQPTFNNNKMVVGLVWDEAGSSVALGEQIVEVDGTSFETVNLCDLLNKKSILEGKEKSTITIQSKDGKLRKLEIEKK